MTSASSMHEAGHTKSVLWDNPEGQDGKGDGRGCSGWGNTCIPVVDTCWLIYGKNHHNIVIILQLNKLIKKEKDKYCMILFLCGI